MITFDELMRHSYADYRKHLPLFIKLSFILYFIPTILLSVAYFFIEEPMKRLAFGGVMDIILGFFTLLLMFTIIKVLLIKRSRHELSVAEALKEGIAHYGEGITLSIILGLALAGLYLLFIVPGVIFSVFWEFVFYALITDNVKIPQAFAHSKKVVEGRWWTVLGYMILLGLVLTGVSIILMVPALLILGLLGMATGRFMVAQISFIFVAGIVQMFTLPFSLTFMEKFYLSLKEHKKL